VVDDADHALLERFRNGDDAAFRSLVVRYQRPVYNAALWVLRNPDDARDVAQTVFLRVAECPGQYDPAYKFFSWIYRMAVNESLNLLRRNGREEALDEATDLVDPAAPDPGRQVEDSEQAARVRQALGGLSTSDRTVIVMRHYGELSYRQIAETLGVDEQTVKSRLFEARQRLRLRLSES